MILTLFFTLIHWIPFHPFHVTVSNINYKEESKTMQISTRIFLDDLEMALQKHTEIPQLNITDTSQWDNINIYLRQYLVEKMRIYNDKKLLSIQYVGAEIEKDVIWCYLETDKVRKLKKVSITNQLLLEIYPHQENIIHFRAYGKVKSKRLYLSNETEVFDWVK